MKDFPVCSARPDWLAYTVWWAESETRKVFTNSDRVEHINKTLEDCGFSVTETDTGRKRKPYTHHYEFKSGKGGLYFNPAVRYGTVEFTGQDCLKLTQDGKFERLLGQIVDRVTRLDIAVDFETALRPSDFVAGGYSERIKTSSEIISATGETCYLGSRKGNRYCRIYRFEEPHPRSDFLRVELVARKDAAKLAAKILIDQGLNACIKYMANNVKFEHPLWTLQEWDSLNSATMPCMEKDAVKTYSWLVKQVRPALHRLNARGVLGREFWLNFVPDDAREEIAYEYNKTRGELTRTEQRRQELIEKYGQVFAKKPTLIL